MKLSKSALKAYSTDASGFKGKVGEVLIPENIDELCEMVRDKRGIVPRGAGTGFTGGAVSLSNEESILDLSKIDFIENLEISRETVEVGAGVVLRDLNNYLEDYGYEFATDILSRNVATVGGAIACNAIGRRSMKYGRISSQIKWIDVVDYMGQVSRKGVTEMSDYIGMEGVTGVIVRVCLKINKIPKRSAELFFHSRFNEVIANVQKLKRNSRISAIEFYDSKVSNFLGFGDGYHLFVEYEDDHLSSVDAFNQSSGEGGKRFEGLEYEKLVKKIDSVYSNVALEGYTRIEDVKVISDKWAEVYAYLYSIGVPVFGSISVGLMHPCFNTHLEQYIPEFIKKVKRQSGRITGSFGIGILKRGFVDINDKKILVNIKKRTDPLSKFNMGKLI